MSTQALQQEQTSTTTEGPPCAHALWSLYATAEEFAEEWLECARECVEAMGPDQIQRRLSLEAEWAEIIRTEGVAALDEFLRWEGGNLARFQEPYDHHLLRGVRDLLSESGSAKVLGLLRKERGARARAFDASTASEGGMASAACGLWWRREFASLLDVSALPVDGSFGLSAPDPLFIPHEMWALAEGKPSRDVATFSADVYEGVIVELFLANARYGSSPRDERYASANSSPDTERKLLSSLMRGEIEHADEYRAGIVILRWYFGVGLMPSLWPRVKEALVEDEQGDRARSRRDTAALLSAEFD